MAKWASQSLGWLPLVVFQLNGDENRLSERVANVPPRSDARTLGISLQRHVLNYLILTVDRKARSTV